MPNIVGARDRDPPEAAADVSPAPATKDTAPASPETALKRSRLVKSAVRPAPAMAADVRKRPRENAALSLVRRPKGAATRAPIRYPAAWAVFMAPASAKLQPRSALIDGSNSA